MRLDLDLLRAKIFHNLAHLPTVGDTLEPRILEIIISEAFGAQHVGDANYYADGIAGATQISIKTRKMVPHLLKTAGQSRDFQSHPDKFLGQHTNHKHQRHTAGVEIVQRRQALDLNDEIAPARDVGLATLQGFTSVIQESYDHYGTTHTQEVVAIHGYDRTLKRYLVSLFWQQLQPLAADNILWARQPGSVIGNVMIDGQQVKIFERVNGNSPREATCFKEYKNLLCYQHTQHVAVPLPQPRPFDQAALLAEIRRLEKTAL